MTTTPTLAHPTEVAVALHLAGEPLSRELTAEQVTALAVRGAARTGIEQVRQYAQDVIRVNCDMLAGQITSRAYRAWCKEFWSGIGRGQLCIDLAWSVGSVKAVRS
jgi:hypothetical protein